MALPLVTEPDVLMATAALPGEDPGEFARPSVVKVVTDARGDALYFSRAPIPHYRDAGTGPYRKHLGIYGYRRDFLFRVAALPPSPLEEAERLAPRAAGGIPDPRGRRGARLGRGGHPRGP